jgi:hypothetical protein
MVIAAPNRGLARCSIRLGLLGFEPRTKGL